MILRSRVLAFGGPAVVSIAALSISLAGQTAQPQPQAPQVFRSTTNLVQVDAVVHDRGGRFVLGVTQDDLQVLENGVPQRIEQFYLVLNRPGMPTPGATTATDAPPPTRRVFVLVFDEADLETGALQRIKKGAEDFVRAEFHEGDLGGVIVNGRYAGGKLTTNRIAIVSAIRAVKPAFDSRASRLRPFRDFPRIPGESEAVRIANGDPFLLQQVAEQACREDAPQCNADGGLQQVENKLQQKSRFYLSQARSATRDTLEAVQMAASGVAGLPGRKTIVLFSDGFFVEESRNQLQQLAGIAARVGATIYAVDGRGLMGGKRGAPDVVTAQRGLDGNLDTGEDGPEMLASGTGGFVVRQTDDVARALDSIARDTSSYYVLGYRPSNVTMDGKFRTIKVVARSTELTVRARQGYVAAAIK